MNEDIEEKLIIEHDSTSVLGIQSKFEVCWEKMKE